MVYNDYIKLTREYLKNLPYYEVAVANMTDDIKEIQISLQDVSTKTTRYEHNSGSSGTETVVEAETEKREEQVIDFKRQAHELRKLQIQLTRINRCISNLPKEEKQAVNAYYINRLSYEDMAEHLGWSERTCKRRVKTATKAVTTMLFGHKAEENIMFVS